MILDNFLNLVFRCGYMHTVSQTKSFFETIHSLVLWKSPKIWYLCLECRSTVYSLFSIYSLPLSKNISATLMTVIAIFGNLPLMHLIHKVRCESRDFQNKQRKAWCCSSPSNKTWTLNLSDTLIHKMHLLSINHPGIFFFK